MTLTRYLICTCRFSLLIRFLNYARQKLVSYCNSIYKHIQHKPAKQQSSPGALLSASSFQHVQTPNAAGRKTQTRKLPAVCSNRLPGVTPAMHQHCLPILEVKRVMLVTVQVPTLLSTNSRRYKVLCAIEATVLLMYFLKRNPRKYKEILNHRYKIMNNNETKTKEAT